jgi:hypothetical protein
MRVYREMIIMVKMGKGTSKVSVCGEDGNLLNEKYKMHILYT